MSTTEQDFATDEQSPGIWFPPPYRVPQNAQNASLAKSLVVSLGTARLYGFVVTSTNVAAQWIQVFDELAVPANGKVPLFSLNVAAASVVGAYYGSVGRAFDRGIIITNSTTQGTLTIGANDCLFDVQYI